MKVGDYVRTYSGDIGILINCPEQLKNEYGNMLWLETMDEQRPLSKKEIKLSSPNIIDLIEVGDYVNGVLINDIYVYPSPSGKVVGYRNLDGLWEDCFKNDEIKSIVTKEMFENMEYKL